MRYNLYSSESVYNDLMWINGVKVYKSNIGFWTEDRRLDKEKERKYNDTEGVGW